MIILLINKKIDKISEINISNNKIKEEYKFDIIYTYLFAKILTQFNMFMKNIVAKNTKNKFKKSNNNYQKSISNKEENKDNKEKENTNNTNENNNNPDNNLNINKISDKPNSYINEIIYPTVISYKNINPKC